MAETIGLNCKMYTASGTFASPGTWTEITSIIDIQETGGGRTKVEASSRASTRKRYLLGLIEKGVSMTLLRSKGDTQQAALKAAYEAAIPTVLIVAFADGAIATTGTIYTKAGMIVSKYNDLNEPLEGTATIEVELCLAASSTDEPTDVTV